MLQASWWHRETNKKKEENNPIPVSVSKSMENIVGFTEISDLLSTFYTFMQVKRSRAKKGYSSSDLHNFAINVKSSILITIVPSVVHQSIKLYI